MWMPSYKWVQIRHGAKWKNILHPEEEAFNQTSWGFVSIISFFPVSFSQFEKKNFRKKQNIIS